MTIFLGALYAPLLFDAKVFFVLFGLLVIFGGVMGYVKAHSVPSLVAGAISGILLVLGALMIPATWKIGMAIELVVCLLLAGRFIPSLLQRKYNPAGYVVPLAIIGAIVAAVLLTGLVVVHA